MIVKQKGQYVLKAKSTGKVLGRNKTKAGALAQERAIQVSKAKKKGAK